MPAFPGINSTEIIDWAKSISGPTMLKGTGAAFTLTGTAATAISDPQYPASTTRGVAYLDGTFYVLAPNGTIYNSLAAGDDPTDWPADGFISAEFESDQGVFIAKCLNNVVVLGQWTTQLFWDAANATGSPLLPVQNGVILIGCASANSVAQTESTIIWMAQRKAQGSTAHLGRFIAILVGTSYEELSTPDVSRVLDADDLTNVRSCVMEMSGHTWYVLALGTTGITLVFDLKTKGWFVWTRLAVGAALTVASVTQTNGLATAISTGHGIQDGDPVVVSGVTPAGFNGTFNVSVTTSGTNSFTYPLNTTGTSTGTGGSMQATPYTEGAFAFVASLGYGGYQIAMDTAGNTYRLSLGTALDEGSIPINWRVRTMNMDEGNRNYKTYEAVTVVGDLAGTATGLVRYTADDYQTFGYFRRFDMAQIKNGEHRWGAHRQMAWEWRYTDRERLRIKALDVDITQGVT